MNEPKQLHRSPSTLVPCSQNQAKRCKMERLKFQYKFNKQIKRFPSNCNLSQFDYFTHHPRRAVSSFGFQRQRSLDWCSTEQMFVFFFSSFQKYRANNGKRHNNHNSYASIHTQKLRMMTVTGFRDEAKTRGSSSSSASLLSSSARASHQC